MLLFKLLTPAVSDLLIGGVWQYFVFVCVTSRHWGPPSDILIGDGFLCVFLRRHQALSGPPSDILHSGMPKPC